MADFNLSAAISLQLADKAVANLKKDIQKGFNVPLEIDSIGAAKKAIKKAQKDADNTPIVVPVTFKNAKAKDQYEDIKKKLKPIQLDVAFDPKSVRANITTAKLNEILGAKKVKVLVEADFDKASAKKLKSIESNINTLTKQAQKLQAVLDKANTASAAEPVISPISGKSAQGFSEDLGEVLKRISALAKIDSKKFGGGQFFKDARNQVKSLILELDKIEPGKGLDLFEKKFQGITGDAKGNLLTSLRTVFGAFSKLSAEQRKINQAQADSPTKNFDKDIRAIDDARAAITKYFNQLDSSDPATFATTISVVMKEVADSTRKSLISASRDIERYNSLLSTLNQKKEGIVQSGGRGQSLANINALIKEVERQNTLGEKVENIKASGTYQSLAALVGQLNYVDISAKRAESAIDAVLSKISKGELKNSAIGKILNLESGTKSIGSAAGAKIAGTTDPRDIEKIKTGAQQDANALVQRVDGVNRQFKRLRSQIAQFEAANFDGAAKSLKGFYSQFIKLAKSGTSVDDIDLAITKRIAQAVNVKGLDVKVNTAIKQIDRLKYALNSSPTEDTIGAKKALDDIETELKLRKGKFANLTPEKLNTNLANGIFDIRAAQRFNEAVDATASKLRNIGDANENLGVGQIYSKHAAEFENAAKKIAGNSDNIGQKLRQLKNTADDTLIKAKFDAEGGFLGSVAKSAGLATKRLAAFLVLAQGLYTVQSFLTSAFSDALKIDKEFVRLEQVFNKDFSGTKLEQTLTSVNKQILNLGKSLGVSTLEVANAAQTLAQAGIAGRDLEKLLGTISKSQLGPSFGNAGETAEATIAIFNQFKLSADGVQAALGGINRVSAKYAVEAKGITEAVRRAGGVFSTGGDDIASFTAAFTLVKQKTREADEAISTGLRNVAQRLQTSKVQEKLKSALGIDLVENGEFIGFERSIERIGSALERLGATSKSPLFSQIRELIGGARQGGRVTPLLQDYKDFSTIKDQFSKGANSIEEDVTTAFQSIENKIQRAKSAIEALYVELVRSKFVTSLVEAFVQVTQFATRMLSVLNSVPGAILAIGAAAKILSNSRFIGQALVSQIVPRTSIFGKNNGGHIPGGGPNKDTLLGALTPGEFVLKRKAVQDNGVGALNALNDGTIKLNSGIIGRNKGGVIPGFNDGGSTGGIFGAISSAINKIISKISSVPNKISQYQQGSELDTSQEKVLGFKLPEIFSRKPKGPQEAIVTKTTEELIAAQKENTEAILKAARAVPASKADGLRGTIPLSFFKQAEKPNINVGQMNDSVKGLYEVLKNSGIKIDDTLLTKSVRNFATSDTVGTSGNAEGSFNSRSKTLTLNSSLTDPDRFNQIVAHEIGHSLDSVLKATEFKKVFDQLEKTDLGQQTVSRVGLTPETYGAVGSAKYQKKLPKELRADIFAAVSSRASGKKVSDDGLTNKLLDRLQSLLSKNGVTFGGAGQNSNGVLEALGIDKVLNEKTNKDSSGLKIPSVYRNKLPQISEDLIQDGYNTKAKSEVFGTSQTGDISKETADKFSKYFKKNNISKSAGPLNVKIAQALPTKNLADFGKTVISTRGGLIALVTGFAAVQGVLGQFGGGLTELVTAMASAAFSMYTFAKAGQAVTFVKNAIGVGSKAIKGATGKAVAAQFAEGNGARVAAANAYKASRVVLPGTGPTLDTASIIAKVKSAPRLPSAIGAGGKSAGALANSALAKQGATISSAVKAFAGSAKTYASGLKAAVGGFNLAAIAVGLFTGAMSYFVDSMETAGREGAVTAKTLEESRSAASKRRFGESTKGAVSLLGKVGTGAFTGASLGTAAFGPAGTAAGAVIGALAAGLLHFGDDISEMFKGTVPQIHQLGVNIKSGISSLFDKISDELFIASENFKGGSFSDKVSSATSLLRVASPDFGLIGDKARGKVQSTYGGKILESQKQKDDLDFRTRQVARRFASDKNSGKKQEFTNENLKDVKDQGLYGVGLLRGVREKKGQNFNFADFAEKDQEKIKDSLQLVADAYREAGPKNKQLILAAYEQEGVDIKAVAREVGIEIDSAGDDMKHAFDELSSFFAKMRNVVELSSARLSGIEGAIAQFSDPSKQNFAPDQLFDILKSGIDPSKLGFGNTFNAGAQRAEGLANQFDPRLAAAGNFEIQGRRAARNTAIAINSGPAPQLKKADEGNIDSFLGQAFSAGNGGNANLDEAFGKFLASKSADDKSKLAYADGDGITINQNEINNLFKEFADTLENGALEEIKRINTVSKQFADEYKSQLAQRFALEGEAIGLLQSNVEKRKSIDEIGNRARGLTGDALAGAQRGQAAAADNQRLGLALRGTGLGGNAGVGQLQGALLASQQRQRNAGAIAQQGGGGAAAVVKREAEIQAVEAERQNRLKAGLQLIANGTDSATFAMNEFERASQKAAASSKYLSDALLGSDDQMHQSILGIQAMAKVQEAYRKGGVGAAQQTLSTFSEDARQALQARAGSSEENQAAFNKAVGIGSNIQAGPEAAAAQGAVQQQMEANNALVAGINNNVVALATNTANMEKFYAAQFANTQQIVQQAEASAKALVGQIANLPQTIQHEGNINVNITGAAGLETLQKGISDYVQQMINRDIEKLTNKLVENNAGLNRP